jgi:hypothetical protein
MQETEKALANAVTELERLFAGRLADTIEVKYGSIHLQLMGKLTSDDVATVYRILGAQAQTVRRWRVQQVNNLLLLSVTTEDTAAT